MRCFKLFTLLFFIATLAGAQTIVPLNTGYNQAAFAPYPAVTSTTSTTQDLYWLNIATYPPTAPPVGPSFVISPSGGWTAAYAGTNWISARNSSASASGVTTSVRGYTIFRECFCLMQNYNSAQLSFTAKADDLIQVWVNSITNVALAPVFGNFNGTGIASLPSQPGWFHAGTNCVYALVEDIGGSNGFDLVGTVQANGLAPLPATGATPPVFFPCDCNPSTPNVTPEDDAMVADLLKIAEEHRAGELVRSRPTSH